MFLINLLRLDGSKDVLQCVEKRIDFRNNPGTRHELGCDSKIDVLLHWITSYM